MNVSVIVTSYNQKEYLIQTLDSILAQTLKPWEIIVCDDGSSDGSREIITRYAISYPEMIKPLFQEVNLGVTRNRNSGIKAARGDYVTTLDGDDLYLPGKLEAELKKARESQAKLVYSNVIYIDEHGNHTGIRYKDNRQREGCLFEQITTLKYPAPREVLIDRRCIEEMGFLDENFKINEDFEWIVRLSSRYPFAAVRDPLVKHRYHSKGLHRSNRLLLLETLALTTEKMSGFVKTSIVEDKQKTERQLDSFLNLTRARIEAFRENYPAARHYLGRSIRQEWTRSAGYDLFMRINWPGLFKKPHRIPDPLMLGPLAIPFYFARGVL
jgi:glycosyltransferase involved in cell wall biosynthesis